MKKRIKAIIGLMLIFAMMFAFCLQSFAAWTSIPGKAKGASYLMATKKCVFKDPWYFYTTDKVTVVNNGSVSMFVYIDGKYKKTLEPGREYTYATYNGSVTVKVYSKDQAPGTQNFVIKTTSGSIS